MSPVGYAEFTKLAEALVMVSPLKVASVTVRKGVVVVVLTVTVDLVSGFVGATRDRPGVMVTTSGVCGGTALKVSAVTVYEPLAPVRDDHLAGDGKRRATFRVGQGQAGGPFVQGLILRTDPWCRQGWRRSTHQRTPDPSRCCLG